MPIIDLTSLTRTFSAMGNALLPCHCVLCDAPLSGELLCHDCQLALPYLRGHTCESCALPLTTQSRFCGHCLQNPPAFSRSLIPFRYGFPIDSMIHRFKYRRHLTQGRTLSRLLADHLQHSYDQQPDLNLPEVIVPVPLHWSRRWLRGFNQTEALGWDLARDLNIPLATRLCRRRQRTPPQRGLSRKERQKNLRQAFSVTRRGRGAFEGRCVALLDDVVTTTSTTRALSKLLMEAGAAEVHVWALARTPDR
ncbi:ComF family protein [Marinimicrobium sp. ABcell2]|uniref:ComF family protein n=1 Tax=Marinimicrobium sp. ABcell2 TaxID=3069751 RepID=UPI0027B5FB35|nr:ComF family protein [Marinimicrobium sp. ABcell2]MDQ2076326.1 ComF family protein [Marinimicrobium sp. ABcell2]